MNIEIDDTILEDDYFADSPYEYNGVKVPRVTHILSMIGDDYLLDWAEKMGRINRSRKEILQTAADKGTIVHAACENYLRYRMLPDFSLITESSLYKNDGKSVQFIRQCNNAFQSFLKWIKMIENNGHVWGAVMVETPLVSKYYGGTMDALLCIDGLNYLVDFKTSNEISYKYVLQLAAYKMILESNGVRVDGCIILRLDKYHKNANPEEMMFDMHNDIMSSFMKSCEDSFCSLVATYYTKLYVERNYRIITGLSRINGSVQ